MKTTFVNYTPIQLKLPVDMERIIEINDSVYTFNEVVSHIDLKKYFVENIMKIWDANRTKFAENMEKESDMKDMLNGIKTVYKKLKDDEESSD